MLGHRWQYRTLEWLQAGMLQVPRKLLPVGVSLVTQGPLAPAVQRWYWDVADLDTLEIAPGVRSVTRATAAQRAIGRVGDASPNVVSEAAVSHASASIR